MRAIAGSIVSTVAAVLYALVVIQFASLDLTAFVSQADNLFEAFILIILTAAFLPFYAIFMVIGIIVVGLVISGAILCWLGKTKPGGIIMIVASAVGLLVCWIWYFIPLAVGIVGGILTLNEK
jgi:hypothetical protein